MARPVIVVSVDPEVICLLADMREYQIVGILDPAVPRKVLGVPVLGPDNLWPSLIADNADISAVLALDSPAAKERLWPLFGERLETVVADTAYIAPGAKIGAGSLIQRSVHVLAEASVGAGCKLNLGVSIHHNAVVEDLCTVAPGARVLGGSVLGKGVYLGAGATVLQNLTVGAGSVVGAGAVVTKDIPPGSVYAGVPARPLVKSKNPVNPS